MLPAAYDVQRGLESQEFLPFFQPLIALRSGQLAGFEILARWQHPTAGIVLPNAFIGTAVRAGCIAPLTQTVLGQALAAARLLPDHLTIAVNISPVQLRDPHLPRLIQEAADAAGFPLHRLTVEITESALLENLEKAQSATRELKALGCRIALDDFGTGYSSLLHLQSLPLDEVKVDRSFVRSMTKRRESRKIVAAVVGLGQSLGLTTIAEGVEKREQAQMLLWLGCELGQGWLFGRPVPATELAGISAQPRERIPTIRSGTLRRNHSWSALPSLRLAHLQAVYDGAPVGLAFLDRNLRYVTLNQRLADFSGAAVEAHLGKTVAEMLPGLFPEVESYLRRALAGEAIAGVEVVKPATTMRAAQVLLVSWQPARDEAGEILGVSVAVADITAREEAEEALRRSEAQLKAVFDATPVGIVLADGADRRLRMANPEARRILRDPISPECTVENVAEGRKLLANGSPMEPQEHPLARALRGQSTEIEEALCLRDDGTHAWVSLHGAPIPGVGGNVDGGVVVIEDIDHRKRERQHLLAMVEELRIVLQPVLKRQ